MLAVWCATFALVVFNRARTTDRRPRIVLRLSEAAKYALCPMRMQICTMHAADIRTPTAIDTDGG